MRSIELTHEQRQALLDEAGKPVEVVDPATHQRYVLLAQEQFDRVRAMLQPEPALSITSDKPTGIPPAILRSQEAYWRELPQLLPLKSAERQWEAYQGDERIGCARTSEDLYQECLYVH